jgi:hypothetical protein
MLCTYRSASHVSQRAASTYSNSGKTIHSAAQVIRHSSYNDNSLDYDIAVLRVCIDEGTWMYQDNNEVYNRIHK